MSKTKNKQAETKLEVVILDTKAWTRNEMCNQFGKCCAVGFIAKTRLIRAGNKHPTIQEINAETDCLNLKYGWGKLAQINDSESGEQRKKLLREEFKKLGFKAVFRN